MFRPPLSPKKQQRRKRETRVCVCVCVRVRVYAHTSVCACVCSLQSRKMTAARVFPVITIPFAFPRDTVFSSVQIHHPFASACVFHMASRFTPEQKKHCCESAQCNSCGINEEGCRVWASCSNKLLFSVNCEDTE